MEGQANVSRMVWNCIWVFPQGPGSRTNNPMICHERVDAVAHRMVRASSLRVFARKSLKRFYDYFYATKVSVWQSWVCSTIALARFYAVFHPYAPWMQRV